jgi:hypothetical protein
LTTLTLRHLPPELEGRIRALARRKRISLNKAVLELLGARPVKKPVAHHDLDHLCGRWSANESAAFDRALQAQRRIDHEDWA